MNQKLGIGLIIVGICFLILGMNESSSYGAGMNLLQGAAGERTLWYLVSGAVSTIFGLYLLATRAH